MGIIGQSTQFIVLGRKHSDLNAEMSWKSSCQDGDNVLGGPFSFLEGSEAAYAEKKAEKEKLQLYSHYFK